MILEVIGEDIEWDVNGNQKGFFGRGTAAL